MLLNIHANAANDIFRKSASEQRLLKAVEKQADSTVPAASDWCRCSVVQSQQLRPTYASIIDLVDIRGASLAEAAKALNISSNNATVRLHRARAALKKQLLEHCGVTSVQACSDCRCVYDGCCTT